MRQMDRDELHSVLAQHERFLGGAVDGARLDLDHVRLDPNLLAGLNLARARLRSLDLSGSILDGISFEDAELVDVDLRRSQLAASRWQHAKLENVDLSAADLTSADFDSIYASGSTFDQAKLERAILYKGQLHGCSLAGAKLQAANLRRAFVRRSSVKGADLSEADLTRAVLEEVDMRGANMQGAILFDARLTGVQLYGTIGFYARADEVQAQKLDFSESGEGEDYGPVERANDPVFGQPPPIHLKLAADPGGSAVQRAEPNTRPRQLDVEQLPIDNELKARIDAWANRYLQALDADDSDDVHRLDIEGRALARDLQLSLPTHEVRYESGATPTGA